MDLKIFWWMRTSAQKHYHSLYLKFCNANLISCRKETSDLSVSENIVQAERLGYFMWELSEVIEMFYALMDVEFVQGLSGCLWSTNQSVLLPEKFISKEMKPNNTKV